MGNQNGAYQYYSHLQVGQIQKQTFPQSNHSAPSMFKLTQSTAIQNYPHQSSVPSQWPAVYHLPQQQYQQNNNIFNLSYQNNPNLNGNQVNHRVSQLSNNINSITYQNTSNRIQFINSTNFNNPINNTNMFNNQQILSNIQQDAASNLIQQSYHVSQVQQTQPLLESNNIARSHLVSNYQLGLPNAEQNNIIIPSILLNPINQSQNLMLKVSKIPNQTQILFTNQIPISLQLQKVNLKLAKDKFDILANDYQYHLFGILQQIQLESKKGIANNDRLIYLLSIKRKFEKNIIEIRMKQQKLFKVLSEIKTITNKDVKVDRIQIETLLQSSNNSLIEMSYNNISQWRQIANSQNHPQFNYVVRQGKSHPHIMFSYNEKMQNKQRNIGISQFSVNQADNNLIIHGGLANSMRSKSSMQNSMLNSSHINMQNTAVFHQKYSSQISNKSNLQSSKHQNANSHVCSVSLSPNDFTQLSYTPENMYETFANKSSFNYPKILKKQPTKQQVPKIANFLQSKAVTPPPQHRAFAPLLPTSDSFQN